MPAFRSLCSACNHACLISFFSSFQLHTPHTQDPTESLIPITHPTHSQSTPPHAPNNYCNRSPSLTEDSAIRAGEIGMVRQPSVDTYDNPDVGLFYRNTLISSTGSIKLRQRPNSHSDGSMDAQDPESNIGYSAERAEIVVRQHHTSEDEDKLQMTQQRQKTGDSRKLLLRDRSVSLSDSLVGILRPKQCTATYIRMQIFTYVRMCDICTSPQ